MVTQICDLELSLGNMQCSFEVEAFVICLLLNPSIRISYSVCIGIDTVMLFNYLLA